MGALSRLSSVSSRVLQGRQVFSDRRVERRCPPERNDDFGRNFYGSGVYFLGGRVSMIRHRIIIAPYQTCLFSGLNLQRVSRTRHPRLVLPPLSHSLSQRYHAHVPGLYLVPPGARLKIQSSCPRKKCLHISRKLSLHLAYTRRQGLRSSRTSFLCPFFCLLPRLS